MAPSSRSVATVAQLLEGNRSLTKVDASNNAASVDGCKMLARALTANSTLTSLDLSFCSLSSEAG
eukprot:56780-Prymnesium_polylepis.1